MNTNAYRLAENLLISSIFACFPDFSFTSIWPDYSVLPFHLRLQLPPKITLHLLVLIDSSLQFPVNLANLRRVPRVSRFTLLLDSLDTCGKVAVHIHCLGAESVKLEIRLRILTRVGVVKGSLLEEADTLKVALDGVNAAINLSTLIEDGVRIPPHLLTIATRLAVHWGHLEIVPSHYGIEVRLESGKYNGCLCLP